MDTSKIYKLEDKIEYLKEIMDKVEYNDNSKIKEISKITLEIISNIVFSMRSNSEFNFFAVYFDNFDIEINCTMTAMAAVYFKRNHYVIVLNPLLLFQKDKYFIRAILEHEMYHTIMKHTIRAKAYEDDIKNNKLTKMDLNIAMDIAINQYIPLLSNSQDYCNFNYLVNVYHIDKDDIQPNKEFDYYLDLMLKHKPNNNQNNSSSGSDNDMIEDNYIGNDNPFYDENGREKVIKDFGLQRNYTELEKMFDSQNNNIEEIEEKVNNDMLQSTASKSRGFVPRGIERIIEKLNEKSIIKWQNVLKQYIGSIPIPYKYVRNRLSRRQPTRLDLYGTMPDGMCNIYCAFDSSGSVSDKEYEFCMNEVLAICKAQKKKFNITAINCDSEINSIVKVKNKRDYANLSRKGYGGTNFSPVIEYLNSRKLNRDSILIYFTDGYGESQLTEIPRGYKVIWVVLNNEKNLSLENPYGRVLRLDLNQLNKKYKK